ncbi:MAG: tRNA adenosine(34) deaminase TadA [Desulfobacula sp.]|nr:tRNA adenosine(34) deaminase TadA [Desulfobacula sp.]
MKDDQYYMGLAIKEAYKAWEIDEVPVGAVIVNKNGTLVGTGFNQPISSTDPTSHAEINAIRQASQVLNNYRLVNTTLFVTIEPCIMCMGAIIHARIKRVVFGANDLKWGAVESLYNMANDTRLNHHPEIISGVFEEKAKKIIKDFFKNKRSK